MWIFDNNPTRLVILAVILLVSGCAQSPSNSPVDQGERLSELNRQAYHAFQNAMLERAEPLYRAIIERQPNNHDAYFMLGNIYTRMGHLDAAVNHYKKAIELSPEDPRIWYNLYLATIQQAIDALEQGLIRTPAGNAHHAQIHRQLVRLYALHNE